MTQRGHDLLQEELKRLKTQDRPKVVDEIRRAREHGDLSENAEYDAAKDKQGMIEARIKQIEDRLARAEVVQINGDEPPDRVRFGTTVELEDLDSGDTVTYTIVGEDEADVNNGMISVTSPVARALIGKEVDEEVRVVVPAGTRTYEIRDVRIEG